MMNNRLRLLSFAALMFVIVGFLYFRQIFSPTPLEPLVIADAQIPSFALVYIADAKGFFEEEGLDITYRKFALGKDALEDAIKGNSDLATVYETPVVRKVYEGNKLSIVTSLHKSTEASGLIGLKEKGITDVSDLVGKRIGYTRFINTEFFLRSLLTINGIDVSEVTLVEMSTDEIMASLQNGTIDAGVLFNPYLYETKAALGENATLMLSNTYTEMSVLTGRQDYVKKNQKTIEKVLRALVRAEEYAKTHKNESIQIVADAIPGTKKDTLTETWDQMNLTLKLDNNLLTILRREAKFFHNQGIYTDPLPEFTDVIFTEPLENIKPEGVTVF